MPETGIERLKQAIQKRWTHSPSIKAKKYVNQFFQQTRTGTKIKAKVKGNHGTYTVSIQFTNNDINSACSCYIGGDGYCHHCEALAFTFLNNAEIFKEVKTTIQGNIQTLTDLGAYLQDVTLESLLNELKENGITQKAFSESIRMSTRHLSAIKSSELRNRYYHELGATKLACL
jgi:uncharacterized Zn finger protein